MEDATASQAEKALFAQVLLTRYLQVMPHDLSKTLDQAGTWVVASLRLAAPAAWRASDVFVQTLFSLTKPRVQVCPHR